MLQCVSCSECYFNFVSLKSFVILFLYHYMCESGPFCFIRVVNPCLQFVHVDYSVS
jgi:hypothetical protein